MIPVTFIIDPFIVCSGTKRCMVLSPAGNDVFAHAQQTPQPTCAACGALHLLGEPIKPHESAQRYCLQVFYCVNPLLNRSV